MAASRWVLLLGAMATLAAAEYAMEGEHYMLSCPNEEVLYWMLNGGGRAFKKGVSYEQEKIEVDSNGTIHFAEVQTEYDGVHLCVTQKEEDFVGHAVRMSVRPKPSEDLWNDVYKSQFITGLISAVICAFLFSAGCLVFRFRYREPKPVRLNGAEDGGHFNPALEVDGDNYSTKM